MFKFYAIILFIILLFDLNNVFCSELKTSSLITIKNKNLYIEKYKFETADSKKYSLGHALLNSNTPEYKEGPYRGYTLPVLVEYNQSGPRVISRFKEASNYEFLQFARLNNLWVAVLDHEVAGRAPALMVQVSTNQGKTWQMSLVPKNNYNDEFADLVVGKNNKLTVLIKRTDALEPSSRSIDIFEKSVGEKSWSKINTIESADLVQVGIEVSDECSASALRTRIDIPDVCRPHTTSR